MLNDYTSITSERTLFPNEVTEHGRYFYYLPNQNKMREVEVDYFTKPVLQVKFSDNTYPTDLIDIPMYARFIKIDEGDK